MTQDNASMLLFADDAGQAERTDAIDRLHNATAIYTAEPVVDELLMQVDWPNGEARLVDPSCGDGMFLGRALMKALTQHSFTDEELPQIIQGWEIHHHAASQARSRIEKILIDHGRTGAVAAALALKIVRNQDFLTDGPTEPTWDVIAGNPPYLRWVNVPDLLRKEYEANVPKYAVSDMLHSFLDRCARTLRDDGQIAFVTSDRWLFNAGAKTLRKELGKIVAIQHLERLDPSSCFYQPKNRRSGTPPRIHPVAVVMGKDGGQPLTGEPIYPGADDAPYVGMTTLGEVVDVRLGPWLGPVGVFVLREDEVKSSGIPAEFLIPAIDTDDVSSGVLTKPYRYAILTDPDVEPCKEIMDHLKRTIHLMPKKWHKEKKNDWTPPEPFHNFDLSQPSLLVPRIATGPRTVRLAPGILPLNHNLSVVAGTPEELDYVERAFASELCLRWIQEHAPRLENGYFSILTRQLRKMPIGRPDVEFALAA
jgi:tRNA1(Val) A37 N6-methylase TrmN6